MKRQDRIAAMIALLKKHDYTLAGDILIQDGIRGFYADKVVRRGITAFEACDMLCAGNKEFTSDFVDLLDSFEKTQD